MGKMNWVRVKREEMVKRRGVDKAWDRDEEKREREEEKMYGKGKGRGIPKAQSGTEVWSPWETLWTKEDGSFAKSRILLTRKG